jgi:hypothetical protein
MNTIKKNGVLKKSPNVACIDLEDEGVLFFKDNPEKKYIANVMTMLIWDLIDNKFNVENIISNIANLCNEEPINISKDIYSILEELKKNNLIELI